MGFEIVWSQFAEKQLDEIYDYYVENVSKRVAKTILQNLLNAPNQLKLNPSIGQIENLLEGRITTYRYLIYKNYKIIYSVDQENGLIKISDVFDTRQNPEKIKRIV